MGRVLSLDDFISRAREIHGDYYDYSLVEYISIRTPVTIICPKHGQFVKSPNAHLSGRSGCPKCSGHMNDEQAVITKAKKIHNNRYDYSDVQYVNMNTKCDIICPRHGKFSQTFAKHIYQRTGCPKCAADAKKGKLTKKQKQYKNEKRKQTCLEKYGVDNPFKLKKVRDKQQQTCLKKYGVPFKQQQHITPYVSELLNNYEWLYHSHHIKRLSPLTISKRLNVSISTVIRYLNIHNIVIERYYSSNAEKEIVEWLQTISPNIKIICNSRQIISPYELDIYLPQYQLAIEYNGLYWHSEAAGKPNDYHLQKTLACEQNNVRLIHIFEDEWRDQQQLCKDTIRHIIGKSPKGVYARKTSIREIPWNTAKQFLQKYHLLGAGNSGNYRIGAFYHNELIAVMVFGLSSSEGTKEIELKRFVTNKNNNPGLGSKMFKYAVTQQKYTSVIAFVDRRWFTGLVKNYIGFNKVGVTKPALWWTNNIERKHRRWKTKKQLLIELNKPNTYSKQQLMELLGYVRIWDCGKIKLRWTSNE